jgi:hypothetical protein
MSIDLTQLSPADLTSLQNLVNKVATPSAVAAATIYPDAAQPYVVGKAYLIRTVTQINVGVVVSATKDIIVLKDASWLGDTGRFSDCLTKGESIFKEIEKFPTFVIMHTGSFIDAAPWNHALPTATK